MSRSVTIAIAALSSAAFLGLLFAIYGDGQQLVFRPIESPGDLVQRLTPLFVIALFVERAIEVFVSPWRQNEEALIKAAQGSELGCLLRQDLEAYKAGTKRIAFAAGVAMGIVVSAVGVRAFGLFVHPDQIAALTGLHARLFTTVDVVITGLAIGGGAEGIHKVVKVFTSFFDTVTSVNEQRMTRGKTLGVAAPALAPAEPRS